MQRELFFINSVCREPPAIKNRSVNMRGMKARHILPGQTFRWRWVLMCIFRTVSSSPTRAICFVGLPTLKATVIGVQNKKISSLDSK